MYKFLKITIPLFFCTLLCIGFIPLAFAVDISGSGFTTEHENIGIGAGGLCMNTLINPIDSNCYVTTCDMGCIYYTTDAGQNWERNNCPRMFTAHYAEDGTLFTGGYGLYTSEDNGKNIQLIHPDPDTIQYTTSIYGRNNIMRVADGYDNGYVVAISTYEEYVYFITINWNKGENFCLYRAFWDGSALEVLYTEAVDISPLESTYQLVAEEDRILCASEEEIWCLDLMTHERTILYTPVGVINDFAKIDNSYFILDDMDAYTNIAYTNDFVTYESLNTYNTLSDTFKWGSTVYTIEWHFRYICGNHTDSIFLCFYTPLPGRSNNGGIMKFDGTQFIWVYDQVWATQIDIAWNSAGIDTTYSLCADPNNDAHCLMSNTNSIYDLYYDTEGNRKVTTLHSNVHTVNGYTCYETTGLDVQTTYFVKENPFDAQNIIICTTDLGLQISYDGGTSFRRMDILYKSIYNTCYDLYFDEYTEGMLYGLWSSRHDAPYNPKTSDTSAVGGFGVSYDGGITWDFDYSSGLPSNSIPVRMCVVPCDNGELTIAVATFNNGFYLSYDSGKTFTSISNGMLDYNGSIWGEDIAIAGDSIYCLTAYCDFDDPIPSYLYRYSMTTGQLDTIDMGELVIAKSLTYNENAGLYVCATAYPYWERIEEIGRKYYVNRGGGVYTLVEDHLELFWENNAPGAYNCAFTSDGVMYITGEYGEVYTYVNGTCELYVDGLFQRLKNISFSRDESTLYITTFGGGTYRMPTRSIDSVETIPQYTVTFCNYDGTVLSTQTVAEGMSAILPETPERASDENYHYIFSRWSESTQVVDCDLTVYACYVYKAHTFALQHAADATCVEDGYTGDNACTACGYVTATGDVLPALGHVAGMVFANDDATHTVICSTCGGDMETLPCHDENEDGYCDVCGYAFPTYYSVTFMDWDGTVLSMQTVLAGESAILPEDPTREPDESGSYTFAYWDTDVTDVQCDLVVTAVYTMVEHVAELRGAYEATCTAEGYTGDTYCSLCGMLLENGEILPMTAHVEGSATTNHDSTHIIFCTVCGVEMHIESCADDDGDGYCDACGYAIAVTKFTKASQFTNGGQYLIVGSGYALRSTLSTEQVPLTYDEGTYYTVDEIPDDMLWTYNNGYLYTKYNGKSYYLTVQRGWGWNASYTLSVTTNNRMTSTWSYSGSALSTRTNEGFWQSSRYLTLSGSGTSLSTRSAVIDLYRLDE